MLIRGDRILIGDPLNDGSLIGFVVVFVNRDGQWSLETKIDPDPPDPRTAFGTDLATFEDFLVVGSGQDVAFVRAMDDHPANWDSYGSGWDGTLGVPDLESTMAPVLGSQLSILVGNSVGTPTTGVLFVGISPTDLPTPWGGRLLVVPSTSFPLDLPTEGLTLPGMVPCDLSFSGADLYMQVLEVDSGASHGISFSRGLALSLGTY